MWSISSWQDADLQDVSSEPSFTSFLMLEHKGEATGETSSTFTWTQKQKNPLFPGHWIRTQQRSAHGSFWTSKVCSSWRWNKHVTEVTGPITEWSWRLNIQSEPWWFITSGWSQTLSVAPPGKIHLLVFIFSYSNFAHRWRQFTLTFTPTINSKWTLT